MLFTNYVHSLYIFSSRFYAKENITFSNGVFLCSLWINPRLVTTTPLRRTSGLWMHAVELREGEAIMMLGTLAANNTIGQEIARNSHFIQRQKQQQEQQFPQSTLTTQQLTARLQAYTEQKKSMQATWDEAKRRSKPSPSIYVHELAAWSETTLKLLLLLEAAPSSNPGHGSEKERKHCQQQQQLGQTAAWSLSFNSSSKQLHAGSGRSSLATFVLSYFGGMYVCV